MPSLLLLYMWRHINLHWSAALLATLNTLLHSLKMWCLACNIVKACLRLGCEGKPVLHIFSRIDNGTMCLARPSVSPCPPLLVPWYVLPSHSKPGCFAFANSERSWTRASGAKWLVNGLGALILVWAISKLFGCKDCRTTKTFLTMFINTASQKQVV